MTRKSPKGPALVTTPLPRTLRDRLPLRSHQVEPRDLARERQLAAATAHLQTQRPEIRDLVGDFCRDVYWTKLRGVYAGVVPDFAAETFALLPRTVFVTDRALLPRGAPSLAEALVAGAVRQRLFLGESPFAADFDPRRAPKVAVPWRHRPGLPFAFWPLDRAFHEAEVYRALATLRPLADGEREAALALEAALAANRRWLARPPVRELSDPSRARACP